MKGFSGVELGLDIGSTTVKGVVLDTQNDVLWKEYLRHNGHQAEAVHTLLTAVSKRFAHTPIRIAVTGSGARSLAPVIDADFIQEVNAVTLAVETLYPQAGSVVELGGQDAKVIIWRGGSGESRGATLTYMNDKCAGGTGSTIDKIIGKIGLTHEEAAAVKDLAITPHKISAKCGVFAETDVVGLLKAGVNKEEIFYSLCHAMVNQNLEVLVRGNILRDTVLLLGGPNRFISALPGVWRKNIQAAWEIQGYQPRERSLEKTVIVPDDAEYFAAMGAVFFNRSRPEHKEESHFSFAALTEHIKELSRGGTAVHAGPLISSQEELEEFSRAYTLRDIESPRYQSGERVSVYVGIDGGSTSTKAVLLDQEGTPIYRQYYLSTGNPIDDVSHIFAHIATWEREQEIDLHICSVGVTGYASDIIRAAFEVDVAVVETVAHMKSANKLFGEVDVICDVGGQDIKVLFMKQGRVVDFKLNTQCSAGNGYFLQGMAEQFNIPVEEYADYAFRATDAPEFNYGCAVFLEQDKVNFQQAGWSKEEMMAGLALVLPQNIWNHVVQEPNLEKFGTRFVLQGGTQKNLAALKAQVDYITGQVPQAEVHVHPYADIGGAIGAGLEAIEQGHTTSTFIGLENAASVQYTTTNDTSTVCPLCVNRCRRTFIDITSGGERQVRFISGNLCERGAEEAQKAPTSRERQPEAALNLVEYAARSVFAEYAYTPLPAAGQEHHRSTYYPSDALHDIKEKSKKFIRSSEAAQAKRAAMTVAIPRLLNMYYYTPFFSTYLRALGVGSVVYSDYTSDTLWKAGNKWGAIDPCFPAKVAPAHIYNIITKKKADAILFPILTHLETPLSETLGNTSCAIQMGTPEVVEAVFTRERDFFAEHNVRFWDPVLNMDRPVEIEGALYDYFADLLDISRDENAWAVQQGQQAQQAYLTDLRERFIASMNERIETDRVGVLLIGHPYHNDPGIHHDIPVELAKKGYPVYTIESLPVSEEFLHPLFGTESDPYSIRNIWQRNFNRNTNHKVWAAMVAARHPNLAVVDLSSFKCGHDAPTYSYIDELLDVSKTPHFTFHDIDQNRPGATFRIRIETVDYFLQKYERWLQKEVASQ
ncbi:BadF/BadG/BcrA/BcrD ATPase family protein [Chitinivibrio alkaliphilus]|uniref:CoA-substrate-specific enzyme activase n=1 Tax=Chitinivibrio alkaliphilus ACht1 TaxID=1313304 RepID=U7D5U4_9BACT|nr:BadF/BadG/BcrA/BcrD ATPase family protein [Chitinivibrio alkaliphilus]ERP30931.1 CoA-substrate-specific enzyme activase [Chitinivibrio alkaliphilus ACht1]